MIIENISSYQQHPKRIISLVPSQTELLFDLGLENEVIAITKFCIHPNHWFQNKIKIGGTKALNIDKIIELQPDLIIANKEENVKEQVESLAELFPVWVSDVSTLQENYEMISDIGKLVNKSEVASRMIASIKKEFSLLESPFEQKKKAIYLIWKNPYMTIGGDTFISDLLDQAGYINVFKDRKRYPEISIEEIRNSDCELVLLSSEPYPFSQKHIDELSSLLPHQKIVIVDGEMFSWYGSRITKSAGYFKNLSQSIIDYKI